MTAAAGPPRLALLSPSPSQAAATLTEDDRAGVSEPKKKRGRKRMAEPSIALNDDLQVDSDVKRKLQNRAAQRAFRERKEKHVADLEARVQEQEAELEGLRQIIRKLIQETDDLRAGQNPPRTVLPPDLADDATRPAFATPPASAPGKSTSPNVTTSPEEVKPTVDSGTASPPDGAAPPPENELALADPPFLPPREPENSAVPAIQLVPTTVVSPAANAPAVNDPPATALDDLNFDFDAPFDFSDSIALPPLFSSLLDGQPDPGLSGSSAPEALQAPPTSEGYEDDVCPGEDDDEPPPLPDGRIPCDKPECDFSSQSCMLPIPWRPPTVSDEKHLWLAQKCWAKLLSHPLFAQVDADELCTELRNHTRCSTDGRLVCHKSDVCDIFRSIPMKARLRAQALSMQ